MELINFIQLLICGILIYACLYSLIDRVCKCVEMKTLAKYLSEDEVNKILEKRGDK